MSKLCLFCECLVAEGGVLLSEVDQDALSSWWSNCLHTELDAETLEDAWSCRQCVADARFWHENCGGELKSNLVWWPLKDPFYKFYEGHELKSLSVNLETLGESDFEDLEVRVEKICCEFCEEKFFIPANLDLHVRRKHQMAPQNRKLKCLFCSKLLKSKGSYMNHLKLFHKNEGFRCQFKICSSVFKTEKSLKKHHKKIHLLKNGKKAFECKVCNIWFTLEKCLKLHMFKEHETNAKAMNCTFCGELFQNKFKLYNHTKQNHKEAVKCVFLQCRFYFKTKEQMEQHFQSAHKHNCKFCPSTFYNENLLFSHFHKIHPDKRCKFFRCVFYTDSKEELEKHVKQKHDKNNIKLECVYCGKCFIGKHSRTAHILRMHSETAIRCPVPKCSHFVKKLDDLEKHKKEAHQRVEKHQQIEECLYCRETFCDNYLAIHIKRAHAAEALRCKYRHCSSYFKSENDRQKHYEEKHTGKYKCAHCEYNCSRKDTLENHLQSHHLSTYFKCPHCPEMLRSKPNLKNHVNYYHKPKEKCPHCNETRSSLDEHIVTADCPACSQPFRCRKLLFDHKLKCKKVHECRDCGKLFKYTRDLKCHIFRRHQSGKKWKGFKCKFCSKFYVDKISYKCHQLSEHVSKLKFNCDLCPQRFFMRDKISRHMVVVHDFGGVKCKLCHKNFYNEHELSLHLKIHADKLKLVECADCGKNTTKCNFLSHYMSKHL